MWIRFLLVQTLFLALLLGAGTGSASAAGCRGADASVVRSGPAAAQRAVRCLVVQERRGRGLPGLRTSRMLGTAARRHALDMVRRRYFQHVSPGGQDVGARARTMGYASGSWSVGEALASQRRATPRRLVRMLMRSAPHRRILLSRSMRDIGAGVVRRAAPYDGPGGTLVLVLGRRG